MERYKDFSMINIKLYSRYGTVIYAEKNFPDKTITLIDAQYHILKIVMFATFGEKYTHIFNKDYKIRDMTYFDYYNEKYSKLTKLPIII